MKKDKEDGLEALQRFYRDLDDLPVPAANALLPKSRFQGVKSWGLVAAPILASACAYVFFGLCASQNPGPGAPVPSVLYRNQLISSGAIPSSSVPAKKLETSSRQGGLGGREA